MHARYTPHHHGDPTELGSLGRPTGLYQSINASTVGRPKDPTHAYQAHQPTNRLGHGPTHAYQPHQPNHKVTAATAATAKAAGRGRARGRGRGRRVRAPGRSPRASKASKSSNATAPNQNALHVSVVQLSQHPKQRLGHEQVDTVELDALGGGGGGQVTHTLTRFVRPMFVCC